MKFYKGENFIYLPLNGWEGFVRVKYDMRVVKSELGLLAASSTYSLDYYIIYDVEGDGAIN